MSSVQPERQAAPGGQPWSLRMADSMLARHRPDQIHWHYDYGLVLMAIQHVGRATGEPRFLIKLPAFEAMAPPPVSALMSEGYELARAEHREDVRQLRRVRCRELDEFLQPTEWDPHRN